MKKRAYIVLSILLIWTLLVVAVISPWIHRVDLLNVELSILAHVNAAIWWLILLWAFHHLAFQLCSLFKKKTARTRRKDPAEPPPIAILYTTCDDLGSECLQSCLNQDYENFRVLICDDSKQDKYKERIETFVEDYEKKYAPTKLTVVRRPTSQGFKAGNLNYAIEHEVQEEWILLVDADQILPANYLTEFAARLPEADTREHIAFVQAAHEAIKNEANSPFQTALAPEVWLYYGRDLAIRESFGFVPFLGHGAMIRRSAWESLGKFPEVVSEDFAFALRAANHGQRGTYLGDVVSAEAFPNDFGGFMVRLKKFAGGTAELFRFELPAFLKGPASFTEKWDFFIALLWYILMPLVVFNGFLSGYVIHKLWLAGEPVLHPMLPFLYTGMLLVILVLHLSVTSNVKVAFRFYFWSTAIYTAAMPLAGFAFVKHLLPRLSRPTFERTPKNETVKPSTKESTWMIALGILALVMSYFWISPFTPFLLGQGVAYVCYPLYGNLCSDSFRGKLSRLLIYLPGLLMIAALYVMWKWASL